MGVAGSWSVSLLDSILLSRWLSKIDACGPRSTKTSGHAGMVAGRRRDRNSGRVARSHFGFTYTGTCMTSWLNKASSDASTCMPLSIVGCLDTTRWYIFALDPVWITHPSV
jgi:hypothetical protein